MNTPVFNTAWYLKSLDYFSPGIRKAGAFKTEPSNKHSKQNVTFLKLLINKL